MAGSMIDNAANYKKIKYTVPAPPPALNQLINSTSITIDFTTRKFLNIGLDPTDTFNVVIDIITISKQFIRVSAELIIELFPLLDNIKQFLSENPIKCRRTIFLSTVNVSISCMVQRGKTVLCIQSSLHEACRVFLNRDDLAVLQRLERTISEAVTKNRDIIRPEVIEQFDRLVTTIDRRFTGIDLPETAEARMSLIENLLDEVYYGRCIYNDFTTQLQIFAISQLSEQWDLLRSNADGASNKQLNGDRKSLADPSLEAVCVKCEEPPAIIPHVAGYSAMTPSPPPSQPSPPPPPPPPQYSPPSFPSYVPSMGPLHYSGEDQDVNDGPDFFNRYQPLSSIMDFDTAVSEMYWIPK